MSKPLRGTISGARLTLFGTIMGTLASPDACAGEPNRNELIEGGNLYTSAVIGLSVENDFIVAETLNSCYIIKGPLLIDGAS